MAVPPCPSVVWAISNTVPTTKLFPGPPTSSVNTRRTVRCVCYLGSGIDDQVHAGSKIKGLEGGSLSKGLLLRGYRDAAQLPHFSRGLFFHLRDGDGCFWLCVLPSAGGAMMCICFWKEPVERLSN